MEKPKTQNPLVSVVIPAFNEGKFIGKTLASLAKQDYSGKIEIIIVDNASTDRTAEIAKKFGAKVIFEPKKGPQYARQRGFEEASGELIASTDADNILPQKWLTRLTTEMLQKPDCVAIGGWFRLKKGPIIPRFLINNFSDPALFLYALLSRKKVLLGSNFMVRKSAFIAVGGFKNLAALDEDLEFAQRLSRIGEVRMNHGKSWAVITSPRRWRNGFLIGSFHYLVNALTYALFGKLIFQKLPDIRDEEPS